METKKCRDCEEEKSIDNFYKKSGRKNQWMPYCKPCHLTRNKKARQINPNTKARTAKNWKEWSSKPENKEKRKEYARKYYAKRSKEDPFYVYRQRLGSVILGQIKKISGKKEGSVWNHLPYTPQELKEHLEGQFEDWMTWENHGNGEGCWNVDHIYPQSKLQYDSLEHPNFQKCWALSNLRPLSWEENLKKRDSIIS
jgi:uncharacterized protein (DUF2249 family)